MNSNNIYTENWINVKNINNNVIYLDNKQMVTGVKIQPRNIFILEENYQNQIIDSLKTFYNLVDYEFWLIIADRPVDINLYISQLQLQLNNTTSPVYRKLIVDDINKAEMYFANRDMGIDFCILADFRGLHEIWCSDIYWYIHLRHVFRITQQQKNKIGKSFSNVVCTSNCSCSCNEFCYLSFCD